jgi:tripartite-type tricarboxylate transporter receptor subunit TctC
MPNQREEVAMLALHRLLLSVAAVAGGFAGFSGASLAESWPQQPVRLIVPLSAGTAIDVSARLFAEQLSAKWGKPVLVVNKPGADGILAAKDFVSQRDNHTLFYSFAGLITINPLLYQKLPYDPVRDLVPIATSSDNFLAIAVSNKSQVGSLQDLKQAARASPNSLNWAATAGLPYFAFAGFLNKSGLEMNYVAYSEFGPAIADLREGRVDVVSTGLTQLLPHHQAGKIKLIAVINRTRSPIAPEIPTAAEAGHPELTFDGVTGFFGWRNMPAELRDRIAADILVVADTPLIRDRLKANGIATRGSTSHQFAVAIEEQRAKVAAIAAAIGTKPQ